MPAGGFRIPSSITKHACNAYNAYSAYNTRRCLQKMRGSAAVFLVGGGSGIRGTIPFQNPVHPPAAGLWLRSRIRHTGQSLIRVGPGVVDAVM